MIIVEVGVSPCSDWLEHEVVGHVHEAMMPIEYSLVLRNFMHALNHQIYYILKVPKIITHIN